MLSATNALAMALYKINILISINIIDMFNTYYFFVTATSTVCSLAFVARIVLQ